jgi:hypothetical protein
MFDFQNALNGFLGALFGFLNDFLNSLFGWLATFFNGLNINVG